VKTKQQGWTGSGTLWDFIWVTDVQLHHARASTVITRTSDDGL
jgi:hypothetical protein